MVNHPGPHPNSGPPQNSVNGGPQQIQQATALPTTMSIAASMQQNNQLQTSMNITGPSMSHSGQHPVVPGGQPNGGTRSSQQTVSIAVQPLPTAHSVSSMAMPMNSHPVQSPVAPQSVMVTHSQAMQAPPPQQQAQPFESQSEWACQRLEKEEKCQHFFGRFLPKAALPVAPDPLHGERAH